MEDDDFQSGDYCRARIYACLIKRSNKCIFQRLVLIWIFLKNSLSRTCEKPGLKQYFVEMADEDISWQNILKRMTMKRTIKGSSIWTSISKEEPFLACLGVIPWREYLRPIFQDTCLSIVFIWRQGFLRHLNLQRVLEILKIFF